MLLFQKIFRFINSFSFLRLSRGIESRYRIGPFNFLFMNASVATDNYKMQLEHVCVYFNHSTSSYQTEGLSQEQEEGEGAISGVGSRISCQSTHMTLFTAKAVETAVKLDNLIQVSMHTGGFFHYILDKSLKPTI